MELKLIHGEYTPNEALTLVTNLVEVKVKFLENQINQQTDEADIKVRETKIKRLQAELHEYRSFVMGSSKAVNVEAIVSLKR